MYIISGSAMRSGSSWYLNLTNDLLQLKNNPDVRTLREDDTVKSVIQNSFADIGKPRYTKLLSLLLSSWHHGQFVVKTHSPPSRGMRILGLLGLIKTTYIYRDPRDRLVSLMNMGRRVREVNDAVSPFWNMDQFDVALNHVQQALWHKQVWEQQPNTLIVRYEQLVTSTVAEIQRLAVHLDIKVTDDEISDIISRYDPQKLKTDAKYTNYRKGQIGGYQDVLTSEQINRIHAVMGEDLIALGYGDC